MQLASQLECTLLARPGPSYLILVFRVVHHPQHQPFMILRFLELPPSQLLILRSKTERSCGLLWNAILSLWLSPQDFAPVDIGEGADGDGGGYLPLGEHHGRIYAKACEVRDGLVEKRSSRFFSSNSLIMPKV